jgi:hypothetical protein
MGKNSAKTQNIFGKTQNICRKKTKHFQKPLL